MAGALLATLFAFDLALRAADHHLSGNLAHVAEIPQIVESVGATAEGGTLLLGNSLTNNGVDEKQLARSLDLQVGKVTPDGTSFWDWRCILHHQLIAHPDRQVRHVIVGTAWHLLSDETRADPSRLGALFCKSRDILRPAELGISGPAEIGEFLTARALRIYALRDTLRNHALARVIPHYEHFTSLQNDEGLGKGGQSRALADRSWPRLAMSYSGFAALVRALAERGTAVTVIAMPVRDGYELDPELIELADKGAIRLLDYRQTPGIDQSSFRDSMHLRAPGRAVLTARLVRDLASGTATPR